MNSPAGSTSFVASLPVYRCVVGHCEQAEGTSVVLVARRAPAGRVRFACFLVDRWGVGIRDCYGGDGLTPLEFDRHVRRVEERVGARMRDVSLLEAQQYVWGAERYGRANGFRPPMDFHRWVPLVGNLPPDAVIPQQWWGKDGRPLIIGDYVSLKRRAIDPSRFDELLRRDDIRFIVGMPLSEVAGLRSEVSEGPPAPGASQGEGASRPDGASAGPASASPSDPGEPDEPAWDPVALGEQCDRAELAGRFEELLRDDPLPEGLPKDKELVVFCTATFSHADYEFVNRGVRAEFDTVIEEERADPSPYMRLAWLRDYPEEHPHARLGLAGARQQLGTLEIDESRLIVRTNGKSWMRVALALLRRACGDRARLIHLELQDARKLLRTAAREGGQDGSPGSRQGHRTEEDG